MNFGGKIAIVTGSSRGFGAKIAETFNGYGAKTVITYLEDDQIDRENAENLSKIIRSDLVLPLNVKNRSSVAKLMKRTYEYYGMIDILVNNAGINIVGDFDKINDDEWQEVLDVDLKGVFICCQEILPYISDGGRIINIGSVSGEYGGPRTPSYACAKAGVMALTHCLARFVGEKNITVNCVSPGPIQSGMLSEMPKDLHDFVYSQVLLKRLGMVDEVAETVAFIASKGAGFITGQTIGVNGGVWV